LEVALAAVLDERGERPSAIVVLSDGRLDRPTAAEIAGQDRGGVPIHTAQLASRPPKDASITAVRVAGAAVAHQAFDLRVEVGCFGGLACSELPVVVRELRDRGAPEVLAQGT